MAGAHGLYVFPGERIESAFEELAEWRFVVEVGPGAAASFDAAPRRLAFHGAT